MGKVTHAFFRVVYVDTDGTLFHHFLVFGLGLNCCMD